MNQIPVVNMLLRATPIGASEISVNGEPLKNLTGVTVRCGTNGMTNMVVEMPVEGLITATGFLLSRATVEDDSFDAVEVEGRIQDAVSRVAGGNTPSIPKSRALDALLDLDRHELAGVVVNLLEELSTGFSDSYGASNE